MKRWYLPILIVASLPCWAQTWYGCTQHVCPDINHPETSPYYSSNTALDGNTGLPIGMEIAADRVCAGEYAYNVTVVAGPNYCSPGTDGKGNPLPPTGEYDHYSTPPNGVCIGTCGSRGTINLFTYSVSQSNASPLNKPGCNSAGTCQGFSANSPVLSTVNPVTISEAAPSGNGAFYTTTVFVLASATSHVIQVNSVGSSFSLIQNGAAYWGYSDVFFRANTGAAPPVLYDLSGNVIAGTWQLLVCVSGRFSCSPAGFANGTAYRGTFTNLTPGQTYSLSVQTNAFSIAYYAGSPTQQANVALALQ